MSKFLATDPIDIERENLSMVNGHFEEKASRFSQGPFNTFAAYLTLSKCQLKEGEKKKLSSTNNKGMTISLYSWCGNLRKF